MLAGNAGLEMVASQSCADRRFRQVNQPALDQRAIPKRSILKLQRDENTVVVEVRDETRSVEAKHGRERADGSSRLVRNSQRIQQQLAETQRVSAQRGVK